MFDIHTSILPCAKYKARRTVAESADDWAARVKVARAADWHPGSVIIATQIKYLGELWVGVVHTRSVPDFCAGLLVHSACTYKAEPMVNYNPDDPRWIREDMIAAAYPLVPDIEELSGLKQPQRADVMALIQRSLAMGVLSHAYTLQRCCLQWGDKEGGQLQTIMQHIGAEQWPWERVIATRHWSADPTDVRQMLTAWSNSQVRMTANVAATEPVHNSNSGNDVTMYAATLRCGDTRIKRTSYPIDSMRQPAWFSVLPSSEIRNG